MLNFISKHWPMLLMWVVLGLIVACANTQQMVLDDAERARQQTEAENTTSAAVSPEEEAVAVVGHPSKQDVPVPVTLEPPMMGDTRSNGTTETDDLDQIVVTGSKLGRPQRKLDRSNAVREAERLRKEQKQREKTVQGQAVRGQSSASSAPGVTFEFDAEPLESMRGELNRIKREPAFTIAPYEEVWIIAKAQSDNTQSLDDDGPGSGAMIARVMSEDEPNGFTELPMPLKHSDVQANIQGYISTVDVTQQFRNPFSEKIEAVYMFPLPEKAAINQFVMTIGERKIRGIIREKAEAERIYDQARAQGYQASLLVQHRPNVFQQKVANIEPGKQIDVNIRYFNTLAYSDGWYSFVFPTVVGPRFNPPGFKDPIHALPSNHTQPVQQGSGVRYLRPNERSGHDLSISVDIQAGVAIEQVESSHPIVTTPTGTGATNVTLANQAMIPNKDFVLSFRVAGEKIKSNMVTYQDPKSGDGYFTLMLYPPEKLENLERQPMEMVFVVDTSGSMSGRPMQQARDAILSALKYLSASDTFQIIRFSDTASQFGPEPVPATPANLAKARNYVERLSGGGGTMMINGIRQSLDFPHDPNRYRVVTFLTDGYIGNDREIIGEVSKRIGAARIFSFGVGSSVNRFLLERMASEGRGAASFLNLEDSASQIMDRYFQRISHPAMTDVKVNWGDMEVSDVYPRKIPDLFVGRPVILTGKFSGDVDTLKITGRAGRSGVRFKVDTKTGMANVEDSALPSVWARRKIADLNDEMNWNGNPELALAIKNTALSYQLMSDYTSFVAVDSSYQTAGTHGTTVHQAVPVPDGVKYHTTVAQ